MRILIGILFTICFSQVALADTTYICTSGNMERKIEVVSLRTGTVPCEVRYTKNGSTEVLWSAQAEEGYCEAKALEFVEKQRGWGWECSESGADMGEPNMIEPFASDVPEGQRLE
jgi:hypothetical protein